MLKGDNQIRIPGGTVHRIIGLLQGALFQLNTYLDSGKIEQIGAMIHRAMRMQHRSFHTPEHIFDLSDPSNPHTTLAALFHDLVYFQVDDGFHQEIETILSSFIVIDGSTISLREDIAPADRCFWGTASIFGFNPGDILSPFAGLNEFLSALLMNCLLEGIVKDVDLLIATCGIELTIPFRNTNDEGKSPAELLEERVRDTSDKFSLSLSNEQIKQAVISAVVLSNRDISNFAEEDPGSFLDNTWKLLPETNPELFFHGLYTIHSYSLALMKMEGFLSYLDPDTVFQQYAGFPDNSEYDNLLKRTTSNLKIASRYLGIKMISAGILQALAELSGGDAPISYFMGEINSEDEWSRLTYHLPEAESSMGDLEGKGNKNGLKDPILYRLLKFGRSGASEFDLENSPLSLFIFCALDEAARESCIQLSRDFLNDKIPPMEYLEKTPPYLVKSIARAASFIAFTRKERLLELSGRF